MNVQDAWDIIKSFGTEFPDTIQKQVDLQILPHFSFTTLDFVTWCSSAGITISISDANQLLSKFKGKPRACSNTDHTKPWQWMIYRKDND